MDRAEAALKVAEAALVAANKAWKAVAQMQVIKGEKGDTGPQGEPGPAGEKGADGIISAMALVDVYKGVWAATEYDPGSLVTFAGSVFLSLEKTTDKPETSEAWKLIVKRGRDGKDGRNGAKGEKGDPGPMGHWKGVE